MDGPAPELETNHPGAVYARLLSKAQVSAATITGRTPRLPSFWTIPMPRTSSSKYPSNQRRDVFGSIGWSSRLVADEKNLLSSIPFDVIHQAANTLAAGFEDRLRKIVDSSILYTVTPEFSPQTAWRPGAPISSSLRTIPENSSKSEPSIVRLWRTSRKHFRSLTGAINLACLWVWRQLLSLRLG